MKAAESLLTSPPSTWLLRFPLPGVEEARGQQRADAGGVHEGSAAVARAGRGDVLELDAGEAAEVREREVVDVVELVRHADGALPAGARVARELGDTAGLPRLGVTVAGEGHAAVDLALGGAPEDR